MAEEKAQERTEQATPKRLKEAREKGQVARSKELTTMSVLIASAGAFLLIGDKMIIDLINMMGGIFQTGRADLLDVEKVPLFLKDAFIESMLAVTPFLMVVTAAAFLAPMALSGWSFSVQAMAFKWEKMDPIKGLQKLFSARGLMELLKALAKFVVVLVIALLLLWNNIDSFLVLGLESIEKAMSDTASMIGWSFLFVSCAMILIAAVDVPFVLWDHAKQLRMTRQEVKDEFKETDGSPELKRRIRQVQHEMAQRRMMEEVPKADVVVTNPTHYSVALRYDQQKMKAPVVVAKGKDLVAFQIRNIALKNNVPILSAPPLSRALFHSTEINKEIPAGLYLAVAQVLAYVYQLRNTKRRSGYRSMSMDDLPIPEDLRHD